MSVPSQNVRTFTIRFFKNNYVLKQSNNPRIYFILIFLPIYDFIQSDYSLTEMY